MIRRKPARGTEHVNVTFTIPLNGFEDPIAVVGDFNDWDPVATVLTTRGERSEGSVVVGSGRRYAFRYLAGKGSWFNDEAADDYQPNDLGGSDSVLDLTDPR